MMVIAVALLVGATARGDDLCQAEKADLDRALARAGAAREALDSYDGSSLAPVVPGQAEKERQQLQDNVEAAWQDLMRASTAHSDCVREKTKKKCKKVNTRWNCVTHFDEKKCCLDGGAKDDQGRKK